MSVINSSSARWYSIKGLWSLFLTCAFPIHLWTIFLILRDIPWLSERTNVWDAVGVGSYGMLRAFIESAALFLAFTLLGFLTPKRWDVMKRIAFLSLLVFLLSLWGMIAQLLFIWNINLPPVALHLLAESGHPVRIMYAAGLAIVFPTIALPVFFFMRSDTLTRSINDFSERLSVLTMVYLFFDLIALVVIMIRN